MTRRPKPLRTSRILDHVRAVTVFVKVVEEGSFRAGAAALGLSPSVASHHVTHLEAQVGSALLYRSTRRLSLTPAGEKLLASAGALVSSTERALDALTSEAKAVIGSLRVTMPTPVAFSPVLPLIWEFGSRNPGLQLSLHVFDGVQDLVAEGFDLAIRMGWREPSPMHSRLLHVARCVLIASPDYVHGKRPPERPSDLAEWNWIHFAERPASLTLRHPVHGAEPARGINVVTSHAAVATLHLAIAGAGVAPLPESVARAALADGRLVEVLPEWSIGTPEVRAFWPASAPDHGVTVRLVDFLETRSRELSPTQWGVQAAA